MLSRKASHLVTSEEYLYSNGKLIFYYSLEGEEGKQWETRIYFNGKGMFKSTVKAGGKELSANELSSTEYSDFKPDPVKVLQNGKKYQLLFVKQMVF